MELNDKVMVNDNLGAMHDEIQKKNLILEQLDTFLVEYSFKSGEIFVDSAKEKFIQIPWDMDDIVMKTNLDSIIFRPDVPAALEFLDFSDVTRDSGNKRSITIRLFTHGHKYQWFRVKQICFFDSEGKKEKVVISLTNTDAGTEAEQSLKFHIEKDTLTHMPSLESFYVKVMELIQSNTKQRYEIVRMDVENFRMINDMFGHTEGNKLLTYIGVRIQECLDEEEEVAYCRAGSDIFIMCVPVKLYSVQGIIEYLKRSIMAYPSSYDVQMAFGVYNISRDDVEKMTPVSQFVDRAAAAQSTIKGNYLHHVAYYNDAMAKQEKFERMILADMKDALKNEEIEIYFQPKVDMVTRKIVGAEALSRWKHHSRGVIMPGQFVPVFEKNGFIVEVDEYVIKQTCKIIRQWIDSGMRMLPVSVNLSRTNLYNSKLVENIENWVKEYNVPTEYLEFELTESSFGQDSTHIAQLAESLQKLGFKVCMDDFGSGYSSLNVLKDVYVNVLKVDIKFLPEDKKNKRACTILRHIAIMAKELDIELVVEGVETEVQRDFLIDMGYRIAQGYCYYKPMSRENYEKQIEEEE